MKYSKYIVLSFCILISACSKENGKSVKTSDDIQLFTSMPYSQTNVDFINKLNETTEVNILTFEYFYNGGGVAAGDINNDGLTDIYLTGNLGPNRLFLNEGNFRFKDITRESGVDGGRGWATGVSMVDINNDGWLDMYVCRSGNFDEEMKANQLFVNNKDNTFTNRAQEYGLADPSYSTQATFFDYDLDGDLDMYLLNHNIEFGFEEKSAVLQNVKDIYVGDKLYKNENGKFIDVSEQAGMRQNIIAYGLGVAVGDLNDDGFPDLYVTNDYIERDYLYMNNGDGTFSDNLKTATKHTSNFSMGCDIADMNNDGLEDIFVLDMAAEDNYRSKTNMSGMNPEKFWRTVEGGFHFQYMINTLQLNRGGNHFSDISQYAGVAKTDWSWAPLFADFDNDGWKDLMVTNGYRKALRNNDFVKEKKKYFKIIDENPNANVPEILAKILSMAPADKLPNYMYKNNGDLTFSKKTEQWGFAEPTFSNGAALADLDNDGDLDIIINNIDQPSQIYRNNAEQLSADNYLRIKLNGSSQNIGGIGSKIEIEAGGKKQLIIYNPSRGYLSCMENIVHFGLGNDKVVDKLTITWPDRKVQVLTKVKANQVLAVNYNEAKEKTDKSKNSGNNTLFTDISKTSKIDFVHIENKFDDFEKEILLPHRMSTLGPCLAVADINGDGLDDFYIGGAMNQPGVLYIQTENNTFVKNKNQVWEKDKGCEDMGAAFLDIDQDGDLDLYVSSGGTEVKEGNPILRDRLYLNEGNTNYVKSSNALPNIAISSSCVKPFDYDNDGDIDVFVGGRVVPGKYPFPAKSSLLQNNNGILTDVTKDLAPELNEIGMVTSALWMDINNDNQIDLVLAGEWMPITVMVNNNNAFSKNKIEGLKDSEGWWFSLEEADIDNDGDMDMIAGNLGLNYKFKTSVLEPFQIYCSDFDTNGTMDIYLGYFQQGSLFPVRGRQCSSQQMPFISEKFETYDAFAKATLPEVLGESAKEALHYEAKIFSSSIIENLGNGTFEIKKLPAEAQFSSVNGIVMQDVNKDNIADLILAGNLYGSEVETPRNDASIGLVLTNDGKGNFNSLPLSASGFIADGDVKAISLVNLSKGSKGILVARNNDTISLLKLIE